MWAFEKRGKEMAVEDYATLLFQEKKLAIGTARRKHKVGFLRWVVEE